MTVTISGTNGIDKVAAGSVESGDIAANAVSQTNLASGVVGNGPAFSAGFNGTQSVTAATFTKYTANIENYDTANCYDATLYRYTPNVPGYYQFIVSLAGNASGMTGAIANVFKNGSNFGYGTFTTYTGGVSVASVILYMNGTTDYVEPFGWVNGVSGTMLAGDNQSYGFFQGCLVRAA